MFSLVEYNTVAHTATRFLGTKMADGNVMRAHTEQYSCPTELTDEDIAFIGEEMLRLRDSPSLPSPPSPPDRLSFVRPERPPRVQGVRSDYPAERHGAASAARTSDAASATSPAASIPHRARDSVAAPVASSSSGAAAADPESDAPHSRKRQRTRAEDTAVRDDEPLPGDYGAPHAQASPLQAKLCARCEPGSLFTAIEFTRHPAWIGVTPAGPGGQYIDPVAETLSVHSPPPATQTRELEPASSDLRVMHRLPALASSWILWWAALPVPLAQASEEGVVDPYGSRYGYPNRGMAFVEADGTARFNMLTPQSYMAAGRRWPRHLHFIMATRDQTRWDPSVVLTLSAWPGVAPSHGYSAVPLVTNPSTGYVNIAAVVAGWDKSFRVSSCVEGDFRIALPKTGLTERDLYVSPLDGDETFDALARRIGNEACVLYGANTRSSTADHVTHKLLLRGCCNIFLFSGGVEAWVRACFPVKEITDRTRSNH